VEETFARSRLVRISRNQQEGSTKMRSNRRRNWFIKRIALGLAIAAVAAPVAQAKVDEGSSVQANGYQAFATDFPSSQVNASNEVVKPIPYRWPSSGDALKGTAYRQFVTDFPSYPAGSVADIGALPVSARDYALAGAERVRLAHSLPRWTDPGIVASMHASRAMSHDPALTNGDQGQPRSIGEPQVVSAGFDWKDAGIGAGLALALVLLGVGAALASRHVGRAQTA
jgi:hypothetical protein